jgi:hypothetical protein
MIFMYIASNPSRSYWECEWTFPVTKTDISISLPGDLSGPLPEARHFYLSLPKKYDQIIAAARPSLQEVFRTWLDRDLPEHIDSELKLAGFGIDDPKANPLSWDISFETTGEKWLGIIVPFIGDRALKATVDT